LERKKKKRKSGVAGRGRSGRGQDLCEGFEREKEKIMRKSRRAENWYTPYFYKRYVYISDPKPKPCSASNVNLAHDIRASIRVCA
jgi:hypothetical protein